ncbi:MAG: site-specific DNA-methyltransferase [Thermoflexales bacterium]|nr:site-specific DNA-methyltransferase [Thermoflexales bacterium]
MPKRKSAPTGAGGQVADYRHAEKRKNIPPAGIAAHGKVAQVPATRYTYDPHLPPVLRFDETGQADRLPELLEIARQRALTDGEAALLAEALRNRQPWLEWTGKREKGWFDVDPVALHIHERVSTHAILKLVQREPLQRCLFADPELDYRQAVQFYRHDVDWANRLILGDSLVVMHSLARREGLAGKVQMIYFDPPYGIKFSSNFQSQVGKRDVKDKPADLTREPEQVKAYRDTWTLGVHSYLAYLRDRLTVARDLLTDSGSIFVQIGDENVHLVRNILDEIFGGDNFISQIAFQRGVAGLGVLLSNVNDHLLWYAKDRTRIRYRDLFVVRSQKTLASAYNYFETPPGEIRRLSHKELIGDDSIPEGKRFKSSAIVARESSATSSFDFECDGTIYKLPPNTHWKTSENGLRILAHSERLLGFGKTLVYKMYSDDFPLVPLSNIWQDVFESTFAVERYYVVQTNTKIIERCLLMTTDPGDLVLDPTCGSGTTAYVAEQWGRRWITIDTSRVAVALARQRLLTARFDYYELADPHKGVSGNFAYKTVPHITLKSIAQNQALDPIFAKWEPTLAEKLAALNAALKDVTGEVRARLQAKLAEKERSQGKSSITEADRRRWRLPPSSSPRQQEKEKGWQEWQVPFDDDPDWPKRLRSAWADYRTAWRAKMEQVNAAIAASAPQETLVDQPKLTPGILRVSGPFTVESVQPAEESLDLPLLAGEGMGEGFGGEPEALNTFPSPDQEEGSGMRVSDEPANVEAYLEKMIRLLRQDGVRFPDNKTLKFQRLDPLPNSILHAEGEWGNGLPSPKEKKAGGEGRRVTVSFGPQYGPVTTQQVEECLREAYRYGYDDLVFAGFAFDGMAQAAIQEDPDPKVRCHMAHVRPDVAMGDLLKDTPTSQLFTVFGSPRVKLSQDRSGDWLVEMEGVDIYDPVDNTIHPTNANKVAAWFLDSDYDGRTFCITQAFFPDASAWKKLARALKSVVDPERFEAFSGARSLPFAAGSHKRIAVKVIDPRGNEVMCIRALKGK